MEELKISSLFDLTKTNTQNLLKKYTYPWEILKHINTYILEYGLSLNTDDYIFYYDELNQPIWIHKTVTVSKNITILGPTIIDENCDIRNSAFIRGNVIVGKNCVLGNSCEFKNSIIFDNVDVPHFSYVGDSVLGYNSHFGAGVITSNIKQDKTNVTIKTNDEKYETGLRKLGAIVGDYVEVGCNSVLNPGTIIGKNTSIYPLSSIRGYIPNDSIVKLDSKMIIVPKTDTLNSNTNEKNHTLIKY